MNELHLFSGIGGGILGGMLLGHVPVCAVELEEYPRKVLIQRQRDGILPWFPIWDDVRTFDGKPWKGKVDVVCGGFPCQDISVAGKGAGIDGERSGLWGEMSRIICEVRPRYVFVENSPALTIRGIGRVLSDLSKMGYDAKWGVVGADSLGANHRRKRIWILADSKGFGRNEVSKIYKVPSPKVNLWESCKFSELLDHCKPWEDSKRGSDCLVDGLSEFVGASKAFGNAQVPIVAATAWRILKKENI